MRSVTLATGAATSLDSFAAPVPFTTLEAEATAFVAICVTVFEAEATAFVATFATFKAARKPLNKPPNQLKAPFTPPNIVPIPGIQLSVAPVTASVIFTALHPPSGVCNSPPHKSPLSSAVVRPTSAIAAPHPTNGTMDVTAKTPCVPRDA